MAFGDTATLRDNFVGADENPLRSGGKWGGPLFGVNQLERLSNVATTAVGARSSFYTVERPGDFEAYATFNVSSLSNTRRFEIYGRISSPGSSPSGYLVRIEIATGQEIFRIIRIAAGVETTLLSINNYFIGSGQKLGISMLGESIQAWVDGGGGWNLWGQVNDGTYKSEGYVGLGLNGNTLQDFSDFYLGRVGLISPPGPIAGRGATW